MTMGETAPASTIVADASRDDVRSEAPGSAAAWALDLQLPSLLDDLNEVERDLVATVETADPFLTSISTHLIRAGGKRLRPLLTLCSSYFDHLPASPRSPRRAINAAVAIELLHLGTLYHDDVIDEAGERRGLPSTNGRWGNVAAILGGDFLLAKSAEIMSALGAEEARLLAKTLGQLCSGQLLEVRSQFDVKRTQPSYFAAIDGKTASLFRSACRVGGMQQHLDAIALGCLEEFGHHLGIAYQIIDDVLDIESWTRPRDAFGKEPGKDLQSGVYTLPVLIAMESSAWLSRLLGGPLDAPRVADAVSAIVETGALDAAREIAIKHVHYAEEAIDALECRPPETVSAMKTLVRRLSRREF